MNEDKAAGALQARQRGHNARKKRTEEGNAATNVQKIYRGRSAREKKTGAPQRFYTPAEVASHDRFDDIWVSYFHKVYDLTELVQNNAGPLTQPIVDAAGTDISHWFNDDPPHDVRTHIDPTTELEMPFTPMGRFLHCATDGAASDYSTNIKMPWWKDKKKYNIGSLTTCTRKIKLMNILTKQTTVLEVPSEETLNEIQRRYLAHNAHSGSYTWKRSDGAQIARVLNMKLTLAENGIPDDVPTFTDKLDIDEDFYIPTIHLYFSDDLTEM